MKQNLYFRAVQGQKNFIKTALINCFRAGADYPKAILDVFLRKNMGERYFSYPLAIIITIWLMIMPIFGFLISALIISRTDNPGTLWLILDQYIQYITWYSFIGYYWFQVQKRRKESMRNPSVFDFEKFSLYGGDIHPFFYKLNELKTHRWLKNFTWFQKRDWKSDVRSIEIFYEPGFCLLIGLALIALHQAIGWVIVSGSISYCLSNWGAYIISEDFIMDKIDQMIMNEEMEDVFVQGKKSNRGVEFHMNKPSSEELRRKVSEAFISEEENEPAMVL